MGKCLGVLLLVAALVTSAACVRKDTAVENRPVADNLASYWTCAVYFSTDGRGDSANEAFDFVPWFESRVRERGVFEPLGRDEQNEAEVTIRLEAKGGNHGVTLRMFLFDAKNNDSLGELEALVSVDAQDAGPEAMETKRALALHQAADQMLDTLKEKRHLTGPKPKPPLPPLPEAPEVGGTAVCSTQCHAPAASASSFDEQHAAALAVTGTMRALRNCLDRVGAQLVDPALLLRFAPDGDLRHMRVDVGGYEQNECVRAVRARLPRVRASRASILRCDYHCSTS
ncbi:MAG: hypothetical protein JWP97_2092 [Labilithrix sp.]|nr:hypothetical protein [Labilithrix sp.]